MWIYASAPDVQVFHVDKNAWLLFLVGIYSCTVWRELWEAVPASTAVVWQVINVFHIVGVGREKKILRVFHFFSPFPLSFLLWTSLFSVLRIFFPLYSNPLIPTKACFSRWLLFFRHVSGTAVIILLPIEGVKCIVSPWMYHLLWEKWAAEQIKNNLIWKRKSKSKAGGARLLRSSKCRKQYFGIAGAEILSKNTV